MPFYLFIYNVLYSVSVSLRCPVQCRYSANDVGRCSAVEEQYSNKALNTGTHTHLQAVRALAVATFYAFLAYTFLSTPCRTFCGFQTLVAPYLFLILLGRR